MAYIGPGPDKGAAPPRHDGARPSEGRAAAFIVWALYLLSLPSANLLVLVGVILAYAVRGETTGVARQHIDAQIALFWSVIWWTIGLWVLIVICVITIILIPIALLLGVGLFALTVWFTIKSLLGVVRLADDRAP